MLQSLCSATIIIGLVSLLFQRLAQFYVQAAILAKPAQSLATALRDYIHDCHGGEDTVTDQ